MSTQQEAARARLAAQQQAARRRLGIAASPTAREESAGGEAPSENVLAQILRGAAGRDGTNGREGPPGIPGPPGRPGRDGADGEDGAEGRVGPMGPVGGQGPQGERGLRGPKGERGDKGDPGATCDGIHYDQYGNKKGGSEPGLFTQVGVVGPVGPQGPPGDARAPSALVDGATVATDASLSNRFRVTVGANRTLGAPTSPTDGQVATWEVTASGADRTLTLVSGAGGFKFGSDITALTPIISGTTDMIGCVYNAPAARWYVLAYLKGF